MKIGFLTILLFLVVQTAWGQFRVHSGMTVTVNCDKSEAPVVHTALNCFNGIIGLFSPILYIAKKRVVISLLELWK